jgi:hypothetical protein
MDRSTRILHAALVIGQILVGATFFLLIRVQGPLAGGSPMIGYATAGLALAILSVAFVFLRPRIPQRSTDQSPNDYWSRAEVRGAAIVIWATVEGAGLFSWIGYLMTASIVPAAVGVVAIITEFALRPSRLEGDEGA